MINSTFTQANLNKDPVNLKLTGEYAPLRKIRGGNIIKTVISGDNSIDSTLIEDSKITSDLQDITIIDSKTGCISRDNMLQYQIDNELGNKLIINSDGNLISISMVSKQGTDLGHGQFVVGGVGSINSMILDSTNKRIDLSLGNNQHIYCDLTALYDSKQDKLISGENIKTINNESILGYGNIRIDKNTLGLNHIDNTADLDKPISNAVQEALTSLDITMRTKLTKIEKYNSTIDFPAVGKSNYLYIALSNHMIYSWESNNYTLLNDFSESYKEIEIINGGEANGR